MRSEVVKFQPADACKHTPAAETTKLKEFWAREANKRVSQGFNDDMAIGLANIAVNKQIRRTKRKRR
jgi:hypothetical protein